jgi:hypothetical protein
MAPSRLDTSIPVDDIQCRQWVLKLLIAINNIDNVCDAQGPTFQKRWLPSPRHWSVSILLQYLQRDGSMGYPRAR